MAVVRRSKNPWMRSMMALRPAKAVVIVLRHGSTDRNRGGVGMDQIRGHVDVPMTEAGKREVQVTAYQIADRPIEVIHSSDLWRAMQTAEIVSAESRLAPPIVPTKLLRSWDMGRSMEGKVTTPDVIAQIRSWVENDAVVPPGGESFKAFTGRLLGYATGVFEDALLNGRTVAIVCHGRSTQVIDFWIAAGCDEGCMHAEFADYLAEEPDVVPPGGGILYKHDGLGWVGQVIPTGAPSYGMEIAEGGRIGRMGEIV